MTENDFILCYNENTEAGKPVGSRVLELAYRIIPDADAAWEIRDEVMEIGRDHCAEFEIEAAWDGNRRWLGLKRLTRERCKIMISRPESENPLAKETLKQWPGDPWGASIAKLSFNHRQVFLLGMGFSRNPRSIYALLNAYKRENEKKITQERIKELQAEALKFMVASLAECYSPDDVK